MITGKHRARSEDYAKSIIDTVREPLLVLDRNLRVVNVSRFLIAKLVCHVLGLSPVGKKGKQ